VNPVVELQLEIEFKVKLIILSLAQAQFYIKLDFQLSKKFNNGIHKFSLQPAWLQVISSQGYFVTGSFHRRSFHRRIISLRGHFVASVSSNLKLGILEKKTD
jgi:hypothetical protein